MRPEEHDGLIPGYFRAWEVLRSTGHGLGDGEDPLDEWLFESLYGMGPASEDLLDVVMALIEQAPDADALAFVIASPLSDLVMLRAEQFGDRLIERMRGDKRFRDIMEGTMTMHGHTMSEPLRGRLFAATDQLRRLPDGVAEKVLTFRESSMGAHRVTLVLRDESKILGVVIAWGHQLVRWPSSPDFKVDDVVDAIDETSA